MGETTSGQDRGRFPLFNLFPNISHPAPPYPVSWPEVASAATAPHPPPTAFLQSLSTISSQLRPPDTGKNSPTSPPKTQTEPYF